MAETPAIRQTESDNEKREVTLSPNGQSVVRGERGRFLPGQAPKSPGRPKASETVVHFLQSAPKKRNKAIADRILTEAEAGSIRHAEMVAAYQSGTPVKVEITSLSAAPELLEAITAMHAMKARLLGEVIEGEYTATEAQRDG